LQHITGQFWPVPKGFGVFEPWPRKSGMGRNIKTGASVDIPKGQSIRFKPGKDLRDIEPS
jgi:DNA-binding protein HU-beta